VTAYLDFEKRRQGRRYCGYCGEWYPASMFGNIWEDDGEGGVLERQVSMQVLEDGVDERGGPGMVDIPDGICQWHRGHFCHLVSSPPESSKRQSAARYPMQSRPEPSPFAQLGPGWWSIPSLLCLHCRKVSSPMQLFEEKGDSNDSMVRFCGRMSLWGRCPWCDGCDTCGLVSVACYVRISRGRKEIIEDTREGGGHEDFEEQEESDEIYENEPGRFVIYRHHGEPWVREWKTSSSSTAPLVINITLMPRAGNKNGICRDIRVKHID
jgi:hypothetical protein